MISFMAVSLHSVRIGSSHNGTRSKGVEENEWKQTHPFVLRLIFSYYQTEKLNVCSPARFTRIQVRQF
jgi:hypothetical protein